jgi:hypothetical protein
VSQLCTKEAKTLYESQDLLWRLKGISREIEAAQDNGPPTIAHALERVIEELGDAMTLLLLPGQVAELRRRKEAASRSDAGWRYA